ncbi:hypothetical protein AbraIFM66950_007573 [Aspergillus brasiliensis]|nr:hypothetical protein AbraIFM66950_007573 [Aspergillus brasiliensis]
MADNERRYQPPVRQTPFYKVLQTTDPSSLALRQISTRDLLKRPNQLQPMDILILQDQLTHHKAHHYNQCSMQPRCQLNRSLQGVCNRAIERQEKRIAAQVCLRPLRVVVV